MNLKKHLSLLVALVVSMSFFTCKDDKDDDTPVATYLKINTSKTIVKEHIGGKSTIQIETDGDWTISPPKAWYTLDKQQGEGDAQISLTILENTSAEEKTDVIIITAGELTETISIKQGGFQNLVVSPKELAYTVKGGEDKFSITSNLDWTVSISENSDWLSLALASGTGNADVKVTVKANETKKDRTAKLTIKAGVLTQEVVVSQVFTELTVAPNELLFAVGVEEGKFNIVATSSWKITAKPEWITLLDPPSGEGTGNKELKVKASVNSTGKEREGEITIKSGDDEVKLSVKQEFGKLEVSTTDIQIDATGGSYALEVTSYAEWKITDIPDWITITPKTSGNTPTKLTVKATENTEDIERKGKFTVEAGVEKIDVNLVQMAKGKVEVEITTAPEKLAYAQDGGVLELTITSNTDWEITAKPEWITNVDNKKGTVGTTKVKLTASANAKTEARAGEISIVAGTTTQKVSVSQVAKPKEDELTLNPTLLNFGVDGGELEFTITAGAKWEISAKPDWVTAVDKLNGEAGSVIVKITVGTNSQNVDRTGELTVVSGEKTAKLSLKQTSIVADLKIDNDYFLSTKNEGVRKVAITASQREWKVENVPSWITVNKQSGVGNGTITFTLATNKSEPRDANINITMGSETRTIFISQWSITKARINNPNGRLHKVIADVSDASVYEQLTELIVSGHIKKGVNGGLDDLTAMTTLTQNVNVLDMSVATLADGLAFPVGWQLGNTFLESVSLPQATVEESSKLLPASMFQNCINLKKIDIPNGYLNWANNKTSIRMFAGCQSLATISLPNTFKKIGEQQFRGCFALTNITIPEGVNAIEYAAFEICGNLSSVKLPSSLTYIGPSAFSHTGITTIELPNKLETIRGFAFGDVKLAIIDIPESVKLIDDNAFFNNLQLKKLILRGAPSIGFNAFCKTDVTEVEAYSTTPPACEISAKPFDSYGRALLRIPKGASLSYKAHEVWSHFNEIVER